VIVLVLVETVLLAVLTVLVAGLLRAHGTVLRRLHQIDGGALVDEGTPAFALRPAARPNPLADADPAAFDVSGETPEGEVVTTRLVDVDHHTLLLFLSSGCETCQPFWDDLAAPPPLAAHTRLLVVAQGPDVESPAELARLAAPDVDVVLSSDAWRDYQVPGSPHAVLVDGRTGRVRGEGTGQSLRQVLRLLVRSTGDSGLVASGSGGKPNRDAQQEAAVDRALQAAGILPGDPRLYGEDA
jgi:hypothetical protein